MILNGKALAEERLLLYKERVSSLKNKNINPKVVVIMLGDSQASATYVNNKINYCKKADVDCELITMPKKTKENELIKKIEELNNDSKVHGILVQLPLPKHINEFKIKTSISPKKDIDCFTPHNTGLFYMNQAFTLPCTPAGVIEILKKYEINVEGKKAVILGRSLIAGKPMAELLNQLNATTTILHSKTPEHILKDELKSADIIVSAIGKVDFITPDIIGTNQILIDIGINRNKQGKLCGDFNQECYNLSSFYTPVPGGVGPMTVSMVIENTLKCAEEYLNIK